MRDQKKFKPQNETALTVGQRKIVAVLLAKTTASLDSIRHEVNHVLNVLEWLSVIRPNAPVSMSYAGLLHDCDRLFPERRMREKDFTTYEAYKRAHAKNCATIAGALLINLGVPSKTVAETKKIIEDHEWGTTPNSYIVMAADSLSYFTFNILDYFRERGSEATEKKIAFMYNRLHSKERALLHSADLPFKQSIVLMKLFKRATNKKRRTL